MSHNKPSRIGLRISALIFTAMLVTFYGTTGQHAQSSAYTLTDLGTLGGPNSDAAGGITNSGYIAGSSEDASGSRHAYLYDPATQTKTDLHTILPFGGARSRANDVNESGQVVGTAEIEVSSDIQHAFLYDKATGVVTDLHERIAMGGQESSALSINDQGQIVGWAKTSDGSFHAFLYDTATGMATDLHPSITLGGNNSQAFGINNAGQVVGAAETSTDSQGFRAFVYTPGSPVRNLGYFSANSSLGSLAYGISDSGVVFGYSAIGTAEGIRAFRKSTSGALDRATDDLGTLIGDPDLDRDHSQAFGINAAGDVVGQSDKDAAVAAFLYKGGAMQDLNVILPDNSGWSLTAANGINDSGQIVGVGVIDGREHAYLLTPSCVLSLSRTNHLFDQRGGEASVDVISSANCSTATWEATSNDSWITITSAATGSGAGRVSFVVRENTGPARQGSLTIAGQQFNVTQAGIPVANCSYSITPAFDSFNETGGTGTINVTAGQGCSWQAKSNAAWVTITSGAGSGSGTVSYTVATNTGPPRKAIITVAGKSFSIKQKR